MDEQVYDLGSSLADLRIEVRKIGDRTLVRAPLDWSAEVAYRKFSDADSIPEWLWVVGTAVVQRRDDAGRPLQVDFLASLERASIGYTLDYTYDDRRRQVTWRRVGGRAVRALDGFARFEPDGRDKCIMRYGLGVQLADNLPPWADEIFRDSPAESVVVDFIEWLETQR